jgi:D-serine deaminase-like pyridoxal phosphate-dependent protein
MKKSDLETPAVLVNLDALEKNIKSYQARAVQYGKQIWPMIKTHKSSEIAKMQLAAGCTGFLTGTLDESERLCDIGVKNIMYAYPVASEAGIARVIALAAKCNFIIRIDNYTGAKMLNQQYAEAEKNGMAWAAKELEAHGFELEIISSGSTPTFFDAVDDARIGIYHPGNYVYNDTIQLAIGNAAEADCALTVCATVVSQPAADVYIMDAGAKCLGLDKGGHGNTNIQGFGRVKGYPELIVQSLSEEVGKLYAQNSTGLKVGDQIEIIPNHSCSTGNLTSYLIGCRQEKVERVIHVDMRGNSTAKLP